MREIENEKVLVVGLSDYEKSIIPGVVKGIDINCLMSLGRYKDAMSKLREQIKSYKPNDSLTFIAKTNMAQCLLKTDQHQEALELFQEVIESKYLGPKHMKVLESKHGIAQYMMEMERYTEALDMLREIEESGVEKLGPKHPLMLATKCNIGQCLMKIGKTENVLPMLKEVEQIQMQFLSQDHLSRVNIAYWFLEMKKYQEALEILEQSIKVLEKIDGPEHPLIYNCKGHKARCLTGLKRYDEALPILKEVERYFKETLALKNKHIRLVVMRNNIATCLINLGQFGDALKILEELADLTQSNQVSCSQQIKTNLAICLMGIGSYELAIVSLQSEIEANEENSLLLLNNTISMARCLSKIGQYDLAILLFVTLEEIMLKCIDAEDPAIQCIREEISKCLTMKNATEHVSLNTFFNNQEIEKSSVISYLKLSLTIPNLNGHI